MSVQVWRCYVCGALCTNIGGFFNKCFCEEEIE